MLLEETAGYIVVGEVGDGGQGILLARQLLPDIVLLSLSLPDTSGIEVLRQLPREVRTILLTPSREEAQMTEGLLAGARGIVPKESASQILLNSIRAVMAGHYWLENRAVSSIARFSGAAVKRKGRQAEAGKTFNLTAREREILTAVVEGRTNREIAGQFSISEQTVKHHVTHIFDKVGVYNRLELAIFALHHRLVGRP